MKFLIKNEKDLENLANKTLQIISSKKYYTATVLALQGELGSGKTTFTKRLAFLLKIKENITSPTFVIQKIFEIKDLPKDNQNFFLKKLIHIDSYRLDLAKELENLGWHDILNQPENLIVIEWPERISELLPKKYILIKFEHIDETTRQAEIFEIKNE